MELRKFLLLFIISSLLSVSCTKNTKIEDNLSADQKVYGLSLFWREVSTSFVYFDKMKFDWDSVYISSLNDVRKTANDYEYYRLLERLCASLNDGHSNIYYPEQIKKLTTNTDFGDYRLRLKNYNGKIYVINTAFSTRDEIPIGSQIIEVNDTNVYDYMAEQIMPYISSSTSHYRTDKAASNLLFGLFNTTVNVKYRTPENEIRKMTLVRKKSKDRWYPVINSPSYKFKLRKDKIGILTINTFNSYLPLNEIEEIIGELKEANALIIDIRNNSGGSSSVAREIAKYIVEGDSKKCSKMYSRKIIGAYNIFKGDSTLSSEEKDYLNSSKWEYLGMEVMHNNRRLCDRILCPTAILIGHSTASAAEDFLLYLYNEDHIVTIGSKTNGSTGRPYYFSLPGGGKARICVKKDIFPDGKEFVGYGIEPDIYVEKSINDYLTYNDPVLDAAINYLTKPQNHEQIK